MPMGFRMLRPAAALLAVLLLAGCVPGDPVITPAPEPDATPVFASDDEALAAATEAYTKYLEVSDEILADGGTNPDRLLAVATAGWAEVQAEGFAKAMSEGLHSVGRTSFDNLSLEKYDSSSTDGQSILRAYVCIDVSNVDVLDKDGKSVVSEDRPDRSPAELVFDLVGSSKPGLRVANVEPWGGRDFCE